MLRITEAAIDKSFASIGESTKAVVDEFFKLGYEVTNGASAMAVSLLHGFRVGHLSWGRPSKYATSRTLGTKMSGRRRSSTSLTTGAAHEPAVLSDFGSLWDATVNDNPVDEREEVVKLPAKPLPRSNSLMTVPYKRRNKLLTLEIGSVEISAATDAFLPQDIISRSTGLVEDLHTASLVNVERASDWLRKHNHSLFVWLDSQSLSLVTLRNAIHPSHVYHAVKNAIQLTIRTPFTLMNTLAELGSLDERNIEQVVREAGYAYQLHEVVTDDGFILPLERVPNPQSKRVVLLEHGVLDSNFCWVANGTTGSLAYKLHDLGYDVWMGGLRGTGGKRHRDKHVENSDALFWDWNLNHHAVLDIPAFVAQIRETKAKEGVDGYTLAGVGHSMGASAFLMYIVMLRHKNIDHHLDKCILLSPAGIHEARPIIVSILGPVLDWTLAAWSYSFRFPSDRFRRIFSKVIEDIRQVPALADFLSLLVGGFMGSRALYEPGLHSVPNITTHLFSGTSVGVFYFFWNNVQKYQGRRFIAFDYGTDRNMVEYGTPEPFDIMAHYHLIDIPVYFTMGLRDNIVHPANIIRHFEALHQHHPHLAFIKAMDSGHVDFTVGGEWRDSENLFEWVATALS